MSGAKIVEGCFAVDKPQGISSAQVVRDLQQHFNKSELFQPWLESERARRQRENKFQRRRRRTQALDVKIGHGGTLDPLATGVLIAGVGKGTKDLNEFLGCTKKYETIVLFGAATDTYDRLGKVVSRAPYAHITREGVEEALARFRGKIMQRPPIFSALKVKGKKLYDYAREGIEPPIEILERPVEVLDLKLVEWYEPGKHDFKWPEEEVAGEEKAIADKMLAKDKSLPAVVGETDTAKQDEGEPSLKRKTLPGSEPEPTETKEAETEAEDQASKRQKTSSEGALEQTTSTAPAAASAESAAEQPSASATETTVSSAPPPPAAKITMTVTSGFYVRSFCHDLGKVLGSHGIMSELVRSRQGDFELGSDRVLEYKDLEAGEEVWGPKVEKFLSEWTNKKEQDQGGAEKEKEEDPTAET